MTTIDPRALADLLGVDLDAAERAKTHGQAKSKANGNSNSNSNSNSKHYGGNDWASRPRAEVDLNQYIEVKAAIEKTTGDRSEDIARIVGACVDSRLTLPHAYWCCAQRDDLVEKLNELSHDDVERCWEKITRSREEEATDTGLGDDSSTRIVDGAAFIFSAADKIPAVWGRGDEVLWAEGESLMIAGMIGLGKTTLAGLLVRALLFGEEVLGLPVLATGEPILYLAMDRPRQIARSMRRQFREEDQCRLSERLIVWQGPPPEDLASQPERLTQMAKDAGASHVFIDSLKDAAIGLSDDQVGAGYNRARQMLIADGRQLCELHHLVKRASASIDDVYGSRWLTAGCGSVTLLSGEPGDPVIGFKHVRAPAGEVGPFQLLTCQGTGEISILSSVDLVALAGAPAESGGLTAKAAASALFEKQTPTRGDIEKARRKLDKEVGSGRLRKAEGHRGGGAGEGEAKWFPA